MFSKLKSMFCKILKLKINDKSISEVVKLIYAYRYLSWVLTSFVYITGKPDTIIIFKLGVIVSLFILTNFITDLYIKNKENKGILKSLVLIETFGITLLLLPTGGLLSPFIWYALNPILVAACYLPAYFCWMNLLFYLTAGSVMSYLIFNPDHLNIYRIVTNNANLILVFSLITLAVQLLSDLAKKLYMQTAALEISNTQKQEAMDYIMSLYQILEALNNHSTREKLFEALADYTAKLTKSDLCFFWLPGSRDYGDIFKANLKLSLKEQEEISTEILKLNISGYDLRAQEIRILNKELLLIPVVTSSSPYGLIAIQKKESPDLTVREQNVKLLEFLSGLCTVILERFNLEDIEDNLIVMEEQNRIANEIHDSVSQRLFSISYAIHGILGRWMAMPKEELKEYLIEMNETSKSAMQELRNSIYRLSSKKNGERSLRITLSEYLDSLSKLHHIHIDYELQGEDELLSLSFKQGLTRIIREACSNAIRHGRCQKIHLSLTVFKEKIILTIDDNGDGFIYDEENLKKQKGLGIYNIKNLVDSYDGNLKIKSEIGTGTQIQIMIPLQLGLPNIQQGGIVV